jgi:hypothetical protein
VHIGSGGLVSLEARTPHCSFISGMADDTTGRASVHWKVLVNNVEGRIA